MLRTNEVDLVKYFLNLGFQYPMNEVEKYLSLTLWDYVTSDFSSKQRMVQAFRTEFNKLKDCQLHPSGVYLDERKRLFRSEGFNVDDII